MTEQEWLASEDVVRMLELLTIVPTEFKPHTCPNVSDRKLRLFACACCRQVWPLLTDPRSRRAVEVAERYADGEATEQERVRAWDEAIFEVGGLVFAAARCADDNEHIHLAPSRPAFLVASQTREPATQTAILRCIVGNPWHPFVVWPGPKAMEAGRRLAKNNSRLVHLHRGLFTPTVLALARAAYDNRPGRKCETCKGTGETEWTDDADMRTDHKCHNGCNNGIIEDGTLDPFWLVLLADALEEVGCDSVDLLSHLRSPGPHVRGCWAVDLVLGRE